MNCKNMKILISKNVDNNLSDDSQKIIIENHLNKCITCKKYHDDILFIKNNLKGSNSIKSNTSLDLKLYNNTINQNQKIFSVIMNSYIPSIIMIILIAVLIFVITIFNFNSNTIPKYAEDKNRIYDNSEIINNKDLEKATYYLYNNK